MIFKVNDLVLVIRTNSASNHHLVGKSGRIESACECFTAECVLRVSGKKVYYVGLKPAPYCLTEDCLQKLSSPGDFTESEESSTKEVAA